MCVCVCVYVCITDSLFYTADANITLQISYLPTEINLKDSPQSLIIFP